VQLPKRTASDKTVVDPYELLRQTMSRREDIRQAADREAHRTRRWEEFEDLWNRLESAWAPAVARLTAFSVVEHRTVWRGEPNAADDWTNRGDIERAFPDRTWTWARSFDFEVAAPGIGVQVVYFLHGLEDHRTGITRFVATMIPRERHRASAGQTIHIDGAKSWMGPLEDLIKAALEDLPTAEQQVVALLEEANRT
jgi:hypothetical protein